MTRKRFLKNETKNEPLNSSNSSTILERIAKRDKQAAEECVDQYGNLVWSIVRKYMSNEADAEDAVQEVFIDIWKNAARFDAAKSPEEAFIVLLARRRMIDRVRKIYRRPQIDFISEIALLNFANNDYQKLHQLSDEKPALKALSKLKPKQKQLIDMAVLKGMSHTEIAQQVGLPLGTVKTAIRRGLQKIRISLKSPCSLPI